MASRKAAAMAAKSKTDGTKSKVTKPAAKKAENKDAKATTKATKPQANTKLKRPTKAEAAAAAESQSESESESEPEVQQPVKKAAPKAKGKAPAKPAKAAAKKPAPKKKDAKAATTSPAPEVKAAPKASRKRKATEEPEVPLAKKVKKDAIINEAPKDKLNVYVFGSGENGELGLGNAKGTKEVKRPRLNPLLSADNVGVVKLATGGMHCIALTADNKVLTWGVNDNGALGRDTKEGEVLKDMKEDEDEDSDSESGDDNGLNSLECTPTQIDMKNFPEEIKFVDVAAGDSMSFLLTDDGQVWGCGTFRSNEGVMGFGINQKEGQCEPYFVRIEELKHIKALACGANHVLALDEKGRVFAWGSGQQNQLGRRITERTKRSALKPYLVGFRGVKNIKQIACGEYHSFVIDDKSRVWAFGSNNYGETGIAEGAGTDNAVIVSPTVVSSLKDVTHIKGGGHHSIAITANGDTLIWGRCDGGQTGINIADVPRENVITDRDDAEDEEERAKGRPKILAVPTKIPNIPKAAFASCGSDHSIVVTEQGQAYSWGFSGTYQTGLGTDDDVDVATLIDNTAVRDKKLVWAGCGGQYSAVASVADVTMTNGV